MAGNSQSNTKRSNKHKQPEVSRKLFWFYVVCLGHFHTVLCFKTFISGSVQIISLQPSFSYRYSWMDVSRNSVSCKIELFCTLNIYITFVPVLFIFLVSL